MKTVLALLLTAALALAAAAPAQAEHDRDHRDHDHDHERARAALEAGQILPLPVLMERLQRSYPGQVLALELEQDDGRRIYKVKLLQPGGQLSKVKVDAQTGQVLGIKTKDGQTAPLPQ